MKLLLKVSTHSQNQLFDVRRMPRDEKLLTECNAMACKTTVFKVAAMWSLTTMVGIISTLLKLKRIHVKIRYYFNVTYCPRQL